MLLSPTIAATALAVSNDCFPAGQRPYRVIEIDLSAVGGAIGLPVNLDLPLGVSEMTLPTRRRTFGMNRHLEVVFFAEDPVVSGRVRSFVHLPVAAFGLAAGTHELPVPSAAPGGGLAVVATDINDAGVIVGFVGDTAFFDALPSVDMEAFVWRLADSTLSSPASVQPGESIHPTALANIGCSSAAFGINDTDPPTIVGAASESFCVAPGCSVSDPVFGFAVTLGAPSSAVWLSGSDDQGDVGVSISRAMAVNSLSIPSVAGFDLSDDTFNCNFPVPETPCPWIPSDPPTDPPKNPRDAIVWTLGSPIGLTTLVSLDGIEAGATAMGIDDEGHIVGDSGCPTSRRATYWEGTTASPLDLAAVCGGAASTAIGRADDVVTVLVCDESEELVMVVGGDTVEFARVWSRFDAQWCCAAISDRVLPLSSDGTNGEYDIEYAHAVAPSGQMVAHGRPRGVPPSTPFSAYFVTCAADFNGDGQVDGNDLGALLNLWGPCPQSGPCVGNLNPESDDVVDGADLGILLNSWSGDEPCTVWPGVTCPISLLGGGGTSAADAFLTAIEFLGFEDIEHLASWFGIADETSRDAVLVSIEAIMVAAQSATEE